MAWESTSRDTLSSDLLAICSLRRKARERVISTYHQLEQSMQRGEEVATSVSSCFAQLTGSRQAFGLSQDLLSQLLLARKLLLAIDVASGGESTLARLDTLLQLPTPDRALKLAADSLLTARTTGVKTDSEKITTTLAHWEAKQDTGCIVPLTLSLDDWSSRLFMDIPPITPSPLLAETTKILSLHIQALAQQIDRAYHAFQVVYTNIQSLSIIRRVDSDVLLLDVYKYSIQHVHRSTAAALSSSVNSILCSSTLEQDASAEYLYLIANLVARFISIVDHHGLRMPQLIQMPMSPALDSYAALHEQICSVYEAMEIDQTATVLATLLLDGELEHFGSTAEYSFQRIRRLERVSKEFIHSLESNVVQQTLSKFTSQNLPDLDLSALYLLAEFVSNYAHDRQLKEQVTQTYRTALNNFASTFITGSQPMLVTITQTQDPSLFVESLCDILEHQDFSISYTSEVASAIIKHCTVMMANILVQNPIPPSQVQCLKQAFKEIADALRNAFKLPAAQICAPFLSLQSILTATNSEEAATVAKGTCLEAISSALIQAYLPAAPKQ